MDKNETVQQLAQQFQDKDWFHSIDVDQFGRIVVYVHYMNQETLHAIPDRINGIRVLENFAASKPVVREQVINKDFPSLLTVMQAAKAAHPEGIDIDELVDAFIDECESEEEEKGLLYLQDELDRLEKICGAYTLSDLFYEVHDKERAVTNMSVRYPEVREVMDKLYEMYGFDVLYNELDG